MKPETSRHSLGNLYCLFNRGVCLKEFLVPTYKASYHIRVNRGLTVLATIASVQ